ncbi:MAG: type II toxin-antitoxin system RelE/ParE family toxin [Actinomycetota bacterium]|nr:type II toxin-antitoxin system RelE/ParE family toxin [Actinomycetota bacterium]
MSYAVSLAGSARRDLSKIPPRAASACVEFIYGPLKANPQRVGKPLRSDLERLHSARRGDYRVLYRILPGQILIVRVDHRASAYRPL